MNEYFRNLKFFWNSSGIRHTLLDLQNALPAEGFENGTDNITTVLDARAWEEHVRRAAARMGGPCVLDANDDNMHHFAQGSFELVRKDLEATLDGPAEVAAVCAACEAVGVLDAFAVRRELINYKKVCLHLMLRVQGTERRLARLTTFYFRVHGADIKKGAGGYVHDERYTALANALQRCKGLLLAVRDGRDLAK